MSAHNFKFDEGDSVEAVFRGKVHKRSTNKGQPDSYVLEIPTRGNPYYRTFYEHEILSRPTIPGGTSNDNVVALREVAA